MTDRNEVLLEGTLEEDVNLRPGKSGGMWGTLRIKTVIDERPGWWSVSVFDQAADQSATLKAGDRVIVTGRLSTFKNKDDKWQMGLTAIAVETADGGATAATRRKFPNARAAGYDRR